MFPALIQCGMRMKLNPSLLVILSAAVMGTVVAISARAESGPELRTVSSVDLKRYVGRWYEIARYPNRFQRKCVGDTSAVYVLRPDGKIGVINSCRKADGTFSTSRGTAKVVDKSTNARLKVTFFWPFSGNYWIIGLDPEYRYAIVGVPDRKYLWILSRTPTLDSTLYQQAIGQIKAADYDPARLIRTQHHVGSTASND